MDAHLRSEEVSHSEFRRRAPPPDASSFLLDRAGRISPIGKRVVFVKEGYLQQCKEIGAPAEEPRWTSLALRREQHLCHTNLRSASALGAPGQLRLGLVEVCVVAAESEGTGGAVGPNIMAANTAVRPALHASVAPPGLDIFTSTLEDQDGVEVPVRAATPSWFVRVMLRRWRHGRVSSCAGSLWTTLDVFIDAGVPDWLIAKERYDAAQRRRWREGTDDFDLEDDSFELDISRPSGRSGRGGRSRRSGKRRRPSGHESSGEQAKRRQRLAGGVDAGAAAAGGAQTSGGSCRSGRRVPASVAELQDEGLPMTMRRGRQHEMDWSSYFCARCNDGGELLECDGVCLRSFHVGCLQPRERPSPSAPPERAWFCQECRAGIGVCTVCKLPGEAGRDVFKCRLGSCGHFYHRQCLQDIQPQFASRVLRGSMDGTNDVAFTCPAHFCHTCNVSGDSRQLMRCWCCPTSYHTRCLPLGVARLNHKNIECSACTHARGSHCWPNRFPDAAVIAELARATDSSPEAMKRSLELGGDVCAECAVAELLHAAGGARGARGGARAGHNTGVAMRDTSRWEARVATGRGTRRAALAAEMAAQATTSAGETHFARITPMQGGMPYVDLTGRSEFCFGSQRNGLAAADFPLRLLSLQKHSLLHVHAGAGVTLSYAGVQARDRYPVTLIRSGGAAETLTAMRPAPLRPGDVICIADDAESMQSDGKRE
ncbi:hypothetical protein WJX81_004201 [Elliptochloris bilobata]|uniref:PHD-type domain-containing protein n=1 Tax=Elliptochloris bilobata TaxID=381761 RepID=A0AAW1RCQ2_9CHLO